MRILLDEDVPVQLLEPLRVVLKGHTVDHVDKIGWKGKKDPRLYPDAKGKGYDAIITHDLAQLEDPAETKAIRDSGMHHVRYTVQTGRDGLGRAMAAVLAAAAPLFRELEKAAGQRLVRISEISAANRYAAVDPLVEPPAYWPRSGSPRRRGKQTS